MNRHSFSAARSSRRKQIVSSAGRNLQSPNQLVLAFYLRILKSLRNLWKDHPVYAYAILWNCELTFHPRSLFSKKSFFLKCVNCILQTVCAVNCHPADFTCFIRIQFRHNTFSDSVCHGCICCRMNAFNRPDFS